jgi:uncharacterized membrane protein YadS
MWIEALLVVELAIAIACITKGELANREEAQRNFEHGKPFYIIGFVVLAMFISTGVAWIGS